MKKILFALAASAALTVASGALAADKYKACFIYVGSKTDGGWTQAHDIGRQMVDKELGDQVHASILSLSPKLRVVTVLRYLQNLSYEDVAETLELSLGTVKSRLARAHIALIDQLRPLLGDAASIPSNDGHTTQSSSAPGESPRLS